MDPTSEHGSGRADIPNLTLSMVKALVGAGVLALPAAVGSLGETTLQALPAAIVCIAATGVMHAFYFMLIGKVCVRTNATSYGQAWELTVGSGSQLVSATITLKTVLSCLAFSIILADSFVSLANTTGWFEEVDRTSVLLAVTLLALLPLCLQRDLSSLAPSSAAGLAAFGFTLFTMVTRYLDGSYQVDGVFYNDLPRQLQPAFGDPSVVLPDVVHGVVLLCTLATAFVAHYLAPRFHTELQDHTVDRYNTVVRASFLISALIFTLVAAVGFGTFGSHTQSLVLNNYSPSDPLATISRAGIAFSIILTYPLPFLGLRDGTLDLLSLPDPSDHFVDILTVALLSLITGLALVVKDLGLVVSVGGGSFSTLIAAVFPVLMFRSAVQNEGIDAVSALETKTEKLLADAALVLMSVSVVIGATGVYLALETTFL